jgi:hypothetical protein
VWTRARFARFSLSFKCLGGSTEGANDMDDISRQDINRRLDEIQRQLWSLGPDEFEARYVLQRERDLLRDRVRVAGESDSHRSTEDLRSELAARRVALTHLQESMVNTAGMSGGGGYDTGSFEGPGDGLKLNTEILGASGALQLVQRIARLETIPDARRKSEGGAE